MKKILLFVALCLFVAVGFAQTTKVTTLYTVPDSTTAFRKALPINTLVLDLETHLFWLLTTTTAATKTLETATKVAVSRGETGDTGPTGPTGADGPTGPTGPTGGE